eukprot:TRINITY_DN2174_c0_g3_i1.p1 TRINITY_DN2174_c0_g3~~TRINITY_DN2174_c0_g3_i1.p1  ORF type:complete len:365 (+),score=43.58 TRINITY_DN2174_c0_g3_i1:522-1616(+)
MASMSLCSTACNRVVVGLGRGEGTRVRSPVSVEQQHSCCRQYQLPSRRTGCSLLSFNAVPRTPLRWRTTHPCKEEKKVPRCQASSDDSNERASSSFSTLKKYSNEESEEASLSPLQQFLYPDPDELPDDKEMTVMDHLEELRERVFVSMGVVGGAMLICFGFAKELVVLLEAPAVGVKFLALSPGEYFFTSLKVSGYTGLLLGSPVVLYEIIAFVIPGLTRSERRFLGPIVLGSSVLFYTGLFFSYEVLVPAALSFFLSYGDGVVDATWSIDQYFEFVLVLMFSTGIAFQVPVIQLLLGQTGLVNADQMLSVWRYVVVGAVIAAAVLTPSTDPLTQVLLAGPLIVLYMGGAYLVKFLLPQPEAQ